MRGLGAAMVATALTLHLSRVRPTAVIQAKMWELAAFHQKPAPVDMDGASPCVASVQPRAAAASSAHAAVRTWC